MPCKYIITDNLGNKITFDDKASLVKYVRDNAFIESKVAKEKFSMTTEDLAASLRQVTFGENNFEPTVLKEFQENLLDEFIKIEEDSQFFYKIGSTIALTKGLGKSFDNLEAIKKNLSELGVNSELTKKVPFDVRYLLTGENKYKEGEIDQYYHKITANNLRLMREIDSLSKTMFMEQTPSFVYTTNKVVANLKEGLQYDKVKDLKDQFSAFSQIAAYKQWIDVSDKKTSTLRNSLIYDDNSNTPTIVDIAKEAISLAPTNTFLQFILPVSTVVKTAKKKTRNINNRDLINTIEGKTRGRLEPDLVATLMDSFTELYQNPKTQFYAKALFDYLIVKDGLMYKNKSFIKMVPTIMFKDISDATSIATKLMASNSSDEYKTLIKELARQEIVDREGNFVEYFNANEKKAFNEMFKQNNINAVRDLLYKKVFGLNFNELYSRFETIYATDVSHQFNLEFIRPKVKIGNSAPRNADGITFVKQSSGADFMYVDLFTNKLKDFEKGSEARKKYFAETLDQIQAAGFTIADNENNEENSEKIYLSFKKFIRLRGNDGKNITYKLSSVDRDGTSYQGAEMTAEGEFIPRGNRAVYQIVDVVGTSNSLGVADLGIRPTREQIIKTIENKIKRDDGDNNLPPSDLGTTPTPGNPVAPQPTPASSGSIITGGIFGGMQQMNYDVSAENIPLDFFTDDQINNQPC